MMVNENDTIGKEIIAAISERNLEKVKNMVNSYGINYSKEWDNGYRFLVCSVVRGFKDIAHFLLMKGAKVNTFKSYEHTPLHIAVENYHEEMVKLLLDNQAHVAAADGNAITPLDSAIQRGHLAICKLLLQSGAPVDYGSQYPYKEMPIIQAATKGCTDILCALIEYGANVNAVDKKGNSVLYIAAVKGHVVMVKEILNFKPDIDKETNRKSLPAAINGRVEKKRQQQIVNMLMDYGFKISPNDVTEDIFFTKFAIRNSHMNVIKEFLNYDTVDVNSLFQIAVKNLKLEVVKLLLTHGADPNSPDKVGATLLHYCASNNNYDCDNTYNFKKKIAILKMLFEHGASVNSQILSGDNQGNTPLHAFCGIQRYNDDEFVKMFLQFGAKIDIVNKDGDTPVHYAAQYSSEQVMDVLLKHGADCYMLNNKRLTPIHCASPDVLNFLLSHNLNNEENACIVVNLCKTLDESNKKWGGYYMVSYTSFEDYTDVTDDMVFTLQNYTIMAKALGYTIQPEEEEKLLSKKTTYKTCLSKFEIKCTQEVNNMKQTMLGDSSISMYRFMKKRTHQLAICLKSKQIFDFLEQGGYKKNYPVYCRVIEGQYIRGKLRKQLLDKVINKCHYIFPCLPLECTQIVLAYLNEKDLNVLIKLLASDS